MTTINFEKKARRSANDHGEFQTQSPQRLDDRYEHMNSRNDHYDLRLNPLQREHYSNKYEKSYVIHCNYG